MAKKRVVNTPAPEVPEVHEEAAVTRSAPQIKNIEARFLSATKGNNLIERIFVKINIPSSLTMYEQFKRTFINGASGVNPDSPYEQKYLGVISDIDDRVQKSINILLKDGFIENDGPVIPFIQTTE